jgi:hypothetical protein
MPHPQPDSSVARPGGTYVNHPADAIKDRGAAIAVETPTSCRDAFRAKAAHEFCGARGRVLLLRVRALDGVAQALSADVRRADPDLARSHLDGAKRILEQRAIPTAGLLTPRTGEDPAFTTTAQIPMNR